MKQIWIIVLVLLMVSAVFANSVAAFQKPTFTKSSRYEVVAYSENFETGATGWTHVDGTYSPNNWHVYNEGGTQGNVWWMGDPALATGANIGGYYDHQYLVMDSPQILVPTVSPTLTFKLKYRVENLGTSGSYNGWDACNIRISTNNGSTWTVLTGSPVYNMTSAYSFGYEHGEGVGIAGWGGNSNGWVNASFDLTTYVGQNVKIRFAFASDPEYSTGDEAALFGMMVDDFALGAYTNNGVNDGQMTWSSMVPLAGDLWHIATVADAPSPTQAYICQNQTGSYNPYMIDYLVSPPIVLPASGDIRADFMLKANMTDANAFPDCDYFGWEISVNNGMTWYAMSNPYGLPSPPANNYVYPPAETNPTSWYGMQEFSAIDGYISDYAGQTAMFRWSFQSDGDTPNGVGFMIDDFKIYNDIFLAEPANLAAMVTGNTVGLSWSAPGGGGQPGWLTYNDGTNADAIGLTNGGDLEVAAKWAPSGTNSILPYIGMNITQVKFFPFAAGVTYTIRIYTGAAGNTVYSQVVTNPTIGEWNTVTLTTPFTIPSGTYVWVGYLCPHTTGVSPAGVDAGPALAGFGDMYRVGSSWTSLYDNSTGTIDANWNIEAYVTDVAGNPVMITPQTTSPNRDLTAYNIYRDDVQVSSVASTVTNYNDVNVTPGLHSYKVTAMYDANESLASNVVAAYVLAANYAELSYDDGTSEQGFNVGSTNMMAVKYMNPHLTTLKYVKVYVSSVGAQPMIIRVFDDNGTNGMPGTQYLTQFSYAAASIHEGWNYIPAPVGSDITIADGSFYIAILEYANSSAIGLDTSQNGHSYKKSSTGWGVLPNGEVLIHCIVQNGTANEDEAILPVVLSVSSSPNPFSKETSISYNLPKDGQTTLVVYNTKGQVVRSLLNNNAKAGTHNVNWNGTDNLGKPVANGIYFYKLSNNNYTVTGKMLLSK